MQNTRERNYTPVMVDVIGVTQMFSVGRNTAMKIGKEAGAVTKLGRRTLYNVKKIEKYLDGLNKVENEVE